MGLSWCTMFSLCFGWNIHFEAKPEFLYPIINTLREIDIAARERERKRGKRVSEWVDCFRWKEDIDIKPFWITQPTVWPVGMPSSCYKTQILILPALQISSNRLNFADCPFFIFLAKFSCKLWRGITFCWNKDVYIIPVRNIRASQCSVNFNSDTFYSDNTMIKFLSNTKTLNILNIICSAYTCKFSKTYIH